MADRSDQWPNFIFNSFLNKEPDFILNENSADVLKEIVRVSREVVIQAHGKRNAWAGMWVGCIECREMFAFGGNWSEHSDEHRAPDYCPTCRLKKSLLRLDEMSRKHTESKNAKN